MIRIIQVNGMNPRFLFTIKGKQTYDGTRRVCYYALSSDTSVIEGNFVEYNTNSLFAIQIISTHNLMLVLVKITLKY